MKIAFDLDGVVYDIVPDLDRFFIKSGFPIIDKSKYDLKKRFGISSEKRNEIISRYGETRPFLTIPLIKKAKYELERLSKNNEIYVVTNRDWNEYGIKDTLDRIKQDRLPIKEDNIYFSSNKGKFSKELEINIFVEDCLDNARDIIKNSNSLVALVDNEYNKGELKDTYRIDNWYE